MSVLLDSNGDALEATDGQFLTDIGIVPFGVEDFVRRLRLLLPLGWFPLPPSDGEAETAPVLVGILSGFGAVLSWIFALLGDVRQQIRLGSASGPFLDLIAQDLFGANGLPRLSDEGDMLYRSRIVQNIIVTRNTRSAVLAAVEGVTGTVPRIVEPCSAADCGARACLASPAMGGGGGYGGSALRYGTLGGGQFFVEASVGRAGSASAVRAAIVRMKAAGVIGWLKMVD